MIKIFIIFLILLLIFKNINENFQAFGLYPKPKLTTNISEMIEIPHNDETPYYLEIISKLQGYSYYVGGGLINSYYTFGFKPEEINKVINLNKAKFRYDARTKKYLVDMIIDKSKLVPLLSLAVKEYNKLSQKTIEKMNEIRDRMYKLEEKKNKEFSKKHLG